MKKGFLAGRTLALMSMALMSPLAMAAEGRANRYIGADEMESQANNLSNYDGGYDNYGGVGRYTGAGDDFLDFNGGGSFADPIAKGKIYNLTIANAANAIRTALLCPGLIRNATGLIADGAFNDTSGNTGLTASGSPQSIAYFNAFVERNPTLVAGFKVSSSNISQFDQNMSIVKETPFKQHESKIINVSIYASEANPNTTLITVPEPFFMNDMTRVSYPVLPSTTVNLGLIFGTSLSMSQALVNKTSRAKASLGA